MEKTHSEQNGNGKVLSQSEETRKLQYTGGSSYIVSLPKKWIQDLGLKQGDHVVILRQGNSTLQIAPASKRSIKEQKEAIIEVSKDNNPYFIARKLIALYFLGFNVINVWARRSLPTQPPALPCKSLSICLTYLSIQHLSECCSSPSQCTATLSFL